MGNSLVTFGAVYAPSNARAGLFTKLHDQVKRLDSQCTWLGGDWNTSYSTLPPNLNPDIENHGGFNNNSSTHINNLCKKLGLLDLYRDLHQEKREFSYRRKTGRSYARSRIDYHLVSRNLRDYIFKAEYHATPNNYIFRSLLGNRCP